MAAHGMSVVELERVGRTGQWRLVDPRPPAVQPADHRADDASSSSPARPPARPAADRRRPDGPDGHRHAEQLRRRRHPVGHGAVRRGELQPVLRRRRRRARRTLKPKLARYGIATTARYPSGSRKWERADERFDLAKHPNEAQPVRLDRRDRPVRPGATPRKHTALGRFKHEGANVIVAEERPRGRLHGRRRAVRLHLQVRVGQEVHAGQLLVGPRAQPDPAGVRHALRGEARLHQRRRDRRLGQAARRRRVRRHRQVDPAGQRQHVVRRRA